MFSRVGPIAYKKDLTNTLALCEELGNPHRYFKTVHIAGTNGKGSVAHIIAAGLQHAGFKVGLYTSPHYKDFRERIKINGELMEKRFVSRFLEKHLEVIESIQPSFFELGVAMAFDYFSKNMVDIAVIETGLGGRLDSTNVITPVLSVITNISFDHVEMLGPGIKDIAGEKAGIIKYAIPVVIGERDPETSGVFIGKAAEKNAEIIWAEDFCKTALVDHVPENMLLELTVSDKMDQFRVYTDLSGAYQVKNISTACTSLVKLGEILGFDTSSAFFEAFLGSIKKSTHFIGRFSWLSQSPRVLIDSAHNEAGIQLLLEEIKGIPKEKLHIVFGTVNDKSPDKIMRLLPKDAVYYFAKANIPRGMEAKLLAESATKLNLVGAHYHSVKKAFNQACKAAAKDDLVLVCGSIFVVAEIL
jgi:dihydrofolate synthase / folylpolyglutamate synthase